MVEKQFGETKICSVGVRLLACAGISILSDMEAPEGDRGDTGEVGSRFGRIDRDGCL
jgi:hypothetical protein